MTFISQQYISVCFFLKVQETSQVTVQRLESYLRLNQKLEFSIHELIELVNAVENLHEQYQEYVDHQDTIERQTIESFARGLIEDSTTSVKGLLVRIQKILSGPSSNDLRALGNVGLLELIAQDMKVNFDVFNIPTITTIGVDGVDSNIENMEKVYTQNSQLNS